MRYHTYRAKAHDLSHSELVALARESAGEGDWSVYSIEWYGDDNDQRATVELVANDKEK